MAALVAGCASPAPPSAASLPDDPASTLPLPDKLELPKVRPALKLGAGAGEPNIAVGPDGTIYVTPIDVVYRSTDGGKSFTTQGKTEGHGDGDIAVDGAGRLHWLGLFANDAPIPYQVSKDGGKTFSKPVDLSDKKGSDREWLDARPEGVLYASWRHNNRTIQFRMSPDNGTTWGPLRTMSPDAVGGPVIHGPHRGEVYEAMTTFGTGAVAATSGAKIQIARSLDDGVTWKLQDVYVPPQSLQFGLVGFPTSIFPVAAADESGHLYVVFSADQRLVPLAAPKPAARFGVYLTTSKDQGATWSPPVLLSDPEKAAVMPWVAAGARGRIAVTWYENVYGLPSDQVPDEWHVMLRESITADSAPGEGLTVRLTTQPNHIGSVCTAGTGCIAGGDRSLLDFFEVAITPQGQPVVTWVSSIAGTAIGIAAQEAQIYFGTVEGTPLKAPLIASAAVQKH